jgi:transposase
MVAITEMLLGMIWVDVSRGRRERLFERIAGDCGITAERRQALPWASNYGGLMMLAWLLADLGHRVRAALTILRAPRFGAMLARLPDVSDALAEWLRTALAPALPRQPAERRTWRAWIDGLPETAADLRQRATQERYKHRRQRLTAFAELRAGVSVESAAKFVRVDPRSVYAWLRRGATGGLEAALERPTGRPALTAAQAEALGQWIAADRRHENRGAVVARAAALFGLDLKPDAASKLLAKHRRAKRGRRRRLWTPGRYERRARVAGATHLPVPGRRIESGDPGAGSSNLAPVR